MISILLDVIGFLFGILDYIVNLAGYVAFFSGIWLKIRKRKKRKRKKREELDQKTDRTE